MMIVYISAIDAETGLELTNRVVAVFEPVGDSEFALVSPVRLEAHLKGRAVPVSWLTEKAVRHFHSDDPRGIQVAPGDAIEVSNYKLTFDTKGRKR